MTATPKDELKDAVASIEDPGLQGLIHWALTGTDEGARAMRSDFEHVTGHPPLKLPAPASSPFERMIDKATGADAAFEDEMATYTTAFTKWAKAGWEQRMADEGNL